MMKHRTVALFGGLLAAIWPIADASGQLVQLKSGEVLIGVVEDPHEDGLQLKRLDTGGLLDLTWDQLSESSARRIKTLYSLSLEDEGEIMVDAEVFKYELAGGGSEEVIGRVISQNESTITVRRRGTNYPVQRSRIKHRAPIEVPAMDVYSGDEFYNDKLTEIAPGDDADKHILLADVLVRVRDYDRAEEHLQQAKKLGDSRQRSTLDAKIDKLKLYKGARAEREQLDKIRVALARREFQKGVALVEEFEQKYPNSKLQDEFSKTQRLFDASRDRFLLYRVAELWYGAAVTLADKKSGESGVSFDAAKEYAEEGMGKDIRDKVQKALHIQPAEIQDLWARRLEEKTRTPRPQRYSFGVGSWTLGAAAIQKDTVVEKQAEPEKAGGSQDMERMAGRIQKAMERARRAASRQGPSGEEQNTPEAWWEAATRDEKKVWLRAYYAEFGGDLVVVNAHLNPCVTCAGDGQLTVYGQTGKAQKVECPTCHGTQYRRWIRAY